MYDYCVAIDWAPVTVHISPVRVPASPYGHATVVPVEAFAAAQYHRKTPCEAYRRRLGAGLIDNDRVIDRHIDDFRAGREYLDVFFGHDYLLLGGVAERFGLNGQRPEPLDGQQDVILLGQECRSDGSCPIRVLGQHLQDFPIVCQRLDGRLPRLGNDVRMVGFGVCLEPLPCPDDFLWVGRCGQEFGKQRVRIQRDRRQEFIELLIRQQKDLRGRFGDARPGSDLVDFVGMGVCFGAAGASAHRDSGCQ